MAIPEGTKIVHLVVADSPSFGSVRLVPSIGKTQRMTVEDHPKWKKWSDAYDALVKAAEDLRNNNRLPPSDPVYEAAVRRHKAALDHYNRISADLD